LSSRDSFTTTIREHKVQISKKEFEKLIEPFVQRTIDCCANALKDATLKTQDIQEIVMVGGSTRVPLVKESVKRFFNKEVHDEMNPMK
jgi:molecular chaperone HscA